MIRSLCCLMGVVFMGIPQKWVCVGLGLLFCLPGCRSATRQQNDSSYRPGISYKRWFFEPPSGTVVGFPVHGDPHKDGRRRLKGYAHVRVKGVLWQYQDRKGSHEADSIHFVLGKPDAGDSLLVRNAVALDSFRIGGFQVYLMATDTVPFDGSGRKMHAGARPGWLETDPGSEDNLCAAASASMSHYDPSPWMQAEEAAIKRLCRQTAIRMSSLQRVYQDRGGLQSSETNRLEVDLEVRNLKIRERYYDPETRACHVLVCCRKSDIHPMAAPGVR